MPRAIEHASSDILIKTRLLLTEHGFVNLNMRTIAAACGMATGTIYNYYKAKDEIVHAVMLEDWRKMLERIDARCGAACGEDPVEKLREIYGELQVFFAAFRDVWMEMAAVPTESKSTVVRGYQTQVFQRELALRVETALPPTKKGSLETEMLTDVIVHLFSIYAKEKGIGYERLAPILHRLTL
jgi:AcrR family transcriptional regulator